MRMKLAILSLLAVALLSGCSGDSSASPVREADSELMDYTEAYTDKVEIGDFVMNMEATILEIAPEPAIPDVLEPEASGILVEDNGKGIIDYSNTQDGYVMVKYYGGSNAKIKAQVLGPKSTYTYTLTKEEWSALPLTEGDGKYQIKIFRNVGGNSYSLVIATSLNVTLTDEFVPFLRPNKYVNFGDDSKIVEVAAELTRRMDNTFDKVDAIYTYVVTNLTYDKSKAATVKSGYVPDLDLVLEEKKGICFDYAALMTGMLRSQGIPCKMVFGYAGNAYHAWISVWTEDTGWISGAIFFDGVNWQRLDPTFASSAKQSEDIMKYIGNGKNYREKYLY